MKKTMTILFTCILSIILFTGVASAHVVVYPKETTQGTYEKFTVRVPSEEEGTTTVKVEVKIPEDVNISRVEPKPGWEYSLSQDDSDKIISVTWTTAGDGLTQSEFAEFNIQGKIGDLAESIVWKAYQTYANDTVVEWIGAEGSDKPASVSVVNTKAAGADGHGVTSEGEGTSQVPLYLSVIALVLALLALAVAVLRKRSAS